MSELNKGDFIKVGKDIGVIVFLEGENDTPDEHLGIWYGEKCENGFPKYRTGPVEYCEKIESVENYH